MKAPARSSITSWSASWPADAAPLAGVRSAGPAINLPGPLAAARLGALGAAVVAVVLPEGDPLAAASPAWYAALHAGQTILCLDLKGPPIAPGCMTPLATSDLLITASRPAALARLGLAWPALHARYPGLGQVAIVGHPARHADRPGHDLTYQAEAGLLTPPTLPPALLADFAGAEEAVSAAWPYCWPRRGAGQPLRRGGAGGRRQIVCRPAALRVDRAGRPAGRRPARLRPVPDAGTAGWPWPRWNPPSSTGWRGHSICQPSPMRPWQQPS